MLVELSRRESLQLLGSVSLGRVAFSARAMPAVRPVSHLVDDGFVIIRADGQAPITSALNAGSETVVAYEADSIDQDDHLGWSVVVIGVARRVTDPEKAAAYCAALRSWSAGTHDQVVAIHIDVITGVRIAPATPPASACLAP